MYLDIWEDNSYSEIQSSQLEFLGRISYQFLFQCKQFLSVYCNSSDFTDNFFGNCWKAHDYKINFQQLSPLSNKVNSKLAIAPVFRNLPWLLTFEIKKVSLYLLKSFLTGVKLPLFTWECTKIDWNCAALYIKQWGINSAGIIPMFSWFYVLIPNLSWK